VIQPKIQQCHLVLSSQKMNLDSALVSLVTSGGPRGSPGLGGVILTTHQINTCVLPCERVCFLYRFAFFLALVSVLGCPCLGSIVGAGLPASPGSGPTQPRARLEYLLARTGLHGHQGTAAECLAAAGEARGLAVKIGDALGAAQAMFHQGYWRYQCGDHQGSLEAYFQAREACLRIGDVSGISFVEENIGHIFLYCYSDYGNAGAYYARALETARRARDANRVVKSLSHLGNFHLQKGDYPRATACFTEALAICESPSGRGDVPRGRSVAQRAEEAAYSLAVGRGVLFCYMSTVHLHLENLPAALDYLQRAEGVFASGGRYRAYGQSRVDLQRGHIQLKQERWEEALKSFQAALDARERLGIRTEAAGIRHWMGVALHQAGRPKEALPLFAQALEVRRAHQDSLGMAGTNLEMGKVFLALGDSGAALDHLEACRRLGESNQFHRERLGVYKALARLWEVRKDLKMAVHYHRLCAELENQVQGPRTTSAVLELVSRYEKQKAEQESRIRERTRWKVFAGLSGLLLGGLGFLLYRARRRRGQTSASAPTHLAPVANATLGSGQESRSKYASSPLSQDLAQTYQRKLFSLMARERPYRDPGCTLVSLAKRLSLNQVYLSQLFNQYLDLGFPDFINALRVLEAQRLLLDPEQGSTTVLDIGFQVGFNSKSNYYRVFRTLTGLAPSDFRECKEAADIHQQTLRRFPFFNEIAGIDAGENRDAASQG